MVTTLEKFAGKQSANYSTNPRIDVEVIEDPVRYCKCGGVIVQDGMEPNGYFPKWVHVEQPAEEHWLDRAGVCAFCGASEPGVVVARQHAWHDASECSRCGGVTGYAIGD